MVEARDVEFGVDIVHQTCKPKNAKVGHGGRGLRHVTYFYNFGIHSISLEGVKLETSNLVCILTARPTNQNAKVGQEGRDLRHVTYLYNFCTPTTFVKRLNFQTSNLVHRLNTRGTIQKMQK